MRSINHAAILAIRLLEAEEDGWIGVDLDGTLAKYTKYKGATHIGEPVPAMVARVRRWVGHGKRVKIFTARADDERSVNAIKKWLKDNELPDLEVTNLKDEKMIEFWDDKAVAVEKNTGKIKEAEDPKDFLKRQAPSPYVAWVKLWIDFASYDNIHIENEGPWTLPIKQVDGRPEWFVSRLHDRRLVHHDLVLAVDALPEELRDQKYAGVLRDLEFYLNHGDYDFRGNVIKRKSMQRRGNPQYHWKIVKGSLPPARLSPDV